MRTFKAFSVFFLIYALQAHSQETFEWTPDYELTLSDFRSPESEVNPEFTTYSVYPGSTIEFFYQMSNAEFAFKKNFNSYAVCMFNPSVAAIVAPNDKYAQQLLKVERYNFDLHELYTRKFRKALFEQKKFSSSGSLTQQIWRSLSAEMTEVHSAVMKETNMGSDSVLLAARHKTVLDEIDALSEYCKLCKPQKKKKK